MAVSTPITTPQYPLDAIGRMIVSTHSFPSSWYGDFRVTPLNRNSTRIHIDCVGNHPSFSITVVPDNPSNWMGLVRYVFEGNGNNHIPFISAYLPALKVNGKISVKDKDYKLVGSWVYNDNSDRMLSILYIKLKCIPIDTIDTTSTAEGYPSLLLSFPSLFSMEMFQKK